MSAVNQATRLGLGFALFNLVVAACLGAILRLAFVIEIPWIDFKNLLHAHSHLAMLGWASISVFAFLQYYFLREGANGRHYLIIYLLLELAALIMTAGFATRGYSFWSILGSSIFILLSYWYFALFFRDLKRLGLHGPATLLVRTAIWFFILSTLFLWSLGPIIALGFRYDKVFYLVIQAFLHFQLNGWFIFGILAMFFSMTGSQDLISQTGYFRRFYRWLLVSTPLTYALAVAWFDPSSWVFLLNGTGVIFQGIALLYFLGMLRKIWPGFKESSSGLIKFLLLTAILCFVLKVLMQTVLVIPWLATVAYTIRYFVIGFLHLILLGFVSISLIASFLDSGAIDANKISSRTGIIIFLAGFLISELVLFTQGVLAWGAMGFIWNYYLVLFIFSCLLPVGAILLFLSYLNSGHTWLTKEN